jgi:hypothetical protein
MKKFLMILVAFMAISFLEAKEAKAVKITITIYFGDGSNCTGKGVCRVVIDVSLKSAPSGGNTQVIDGTAEVKGDKLYVTLSKEISEMAIKEQGVKVWSVKTPQQLSQDVAKQLGYNNLMILPNSYACERNTFVFDIKGSPSSKPAKRVSATGTN